MEDVSEITLKRSDAEVIYALIEKKEITWQGKQR